MPYSNGNLNKIDYFFTANSTYIRSSNWTYDVKKNPLNEIIGLSKTGYRRGTYCPYPNNEKTSYNTNNTYTYNSTNYPIKINGLEYGDPFVTEYFY